LLYDRVVELGGPLAQSSRRARRPHQFVANPPPVPANITATALATNQINVTCPHPPVPPRTSSRGRQSHRHRVGKPYLDGVLTANTQYCYTIAARMRWRCLLFVSWRDMAALRRVAMVACGFDQLLVLRRARP